MWISIPNFIYFKTPLSGGEAAVIKAGQASLTGFFKCVAQIEAGVIHGFYHNIEAGASGAVEEIG